MIKSFYQYVQMVSEAGPPTPPPPPPGGDANAPPDPNAPGGAPPPGADPMAGGMGGGGMGGADPMGGGAGAGGGAAAPKAAINVTTVWDAIRGVLGKHAERQEGVRKPHHKSNDDQEKQKTKLKSLMQ